MIMRITLWCKVIYVWNRLCLVLVHLGFNANCIRHIRRDFRRVLWRSLRWNLNPHSRPPLELRSDTPFLLVLAGLPPHKNFNAARHLQLHQSESNSAWQNMTNTWHGVMEKFSSCSSPSCESRSVTASAGCMSEVRKRVRRVSEYSLVRRSQDRMRLQASAVSGKSSTRQRSYLSMGRGNGIDDDRSQEKQTQEKPTNGS